VINPKIACSSRSYNRNNTEQYDSPIYTASPKKCMTLCVCLSLMTSNCYYLHAGLYVHSINTFNTFTWTNTFIDMLGSHMIHRGSVYLWYIHTKSPSTPSGLADTSTAPRAVRWRSVYTCVYPRMRARRLTSRPRRSLCGRSSWWRTDPSSCVQSVRCARWAPRRSVHRTRS